MLRSSQLTSALTSAVTTGVTPRAWFNADALKLNNVGASLIHDYGKNRYYDSAVGPRTFPFTATRTTNATMFDNQGRLVWAPNQYAAATEDLTSASWAKAAGTGGPPTVTPGFTAPDGTATAWGLDCTDGNGRIANSSITSLTTLGGNVTFSFWARTWPGDPDGTISSRLRQRDGVQGPNNEISITSTWQRVSFTLDCLTGAFQILAYVIDAGQPSTLDRMLLWHPMLSSGDVVYDYIPNASTASAVHCHRLDYDPATLLPRGVLVEETRNNLIPASLNIPVSSMSELNVTRSASPARYLGEWSAVRLTSNGLANSHGAYPHSLAPTGSSVVGMHAIIKPISGGTFYQLTGSGSWMVDLNGYANFDLTGDGSVTQVGASASTPFIEHLGGGVYFLGVSVTTTAAPGNAAACIIGLLTSGTDLRLPVNSSAAVFDYIYAGFYQSQSGWSSVIPTFGATATRGADTLSAAAGSWLTQGSGTIYAEFSHPTIVAGIYPAILQIDDGTGNNRVQAFSQSNASTTSTGARIDLAGVAQVNTGVVNTVPYFYSSKYALSYELNNARMTLNGGAVVVDSVVTVPTGLTTYRPGGTQSPTTSARWLKELRFYPTASASDAQLQTLTA